MSAIRMRTGRASRSREGGTTANPDTTAIPFGYVIVSGTDTNNDGFFDVTIGNLPGFSIWVANGIDIATSGTCRPCP